MAIFIPCIQETTCKLEGQQHNNNQQRDNSSVTGGGSCVATSELGAGRHWQPALPAERERRWELRKEGTGHSETLMLLAALKMLWSEACACNFINILRGPITSNFFSHYPEEERGCICHFVINLQCRYRNCILILLTRLIRRYHSFMHHNIINLSMWDSGIIHPSLVWRPGLS